MDTSDFQVKEGKKLDLKDFSTDSTGKYNDKDEAAQDLQKNIEKMAELQDKLYAQNNHALLLVFQAMDAAGKDGAIKHVMSGLNPQGCHVTAFKQPSAEELDHDFMWRTTKALPERGRIGIFNRSYYEEVLVVRVHPNILQFQQLPAGFADDKDIWDKRLNDIKNFESFLSRQGTHVMKFYLHVSKDEQKKRFLERIDQPEKNWKFSAGDVKERAFWDDYMHAYTEAMEKTSTEKSPWYVIPADKKWFTRLAISEIIVQKLESLNVEYPTISESEKAELAECKAKLLAE